MYRGSRHIYIPAHLPAAAPGAEWPMPCNWRLHLFLAPAINPLETSLHSSTVADGPQHATNSAIPASHLVGIDVSTRVVWLRDRWLSAQSIGPASAWVCRGRLQVERLMSQGSAARKETQMETQHTPYSTLWAPHIDDQSPNATQVIRDITHHAQ